MGVGSEKKVKKRLSSQLIPVDKGEKIHTTYCIAFGRIINFSVPTNDFTKGKKQARKEYREIRTSVKLKWKHTNNHS